MWKLATTNFSKRKMLNALSRQREFGDGLNHTQFIYLVSSSLSVTHITCSHQMLLMYYTLIAGLVPVFGLSI